MNLYFKRFLLFGFCLIGSVSYAQITVTNGYIISNENDTVYGRLEKSNTGYFKRCVFVKDNSTAIEYLKPDQVKKFHVAPDIFFDAIEYNGKKKFLRLLSTGKINLFSDESNLYISDNESNASMLLGGEKVITIDGTECFKPDEAYKTQIMIINPDSAYFNRIQKLKFQPQKVYELINDINGNGKMSDIGCEPGKVFNRIHFGIEAGVTINQIGLYDLNYYGAYYMNRPSIVNLYAAGVYAGANFKLKIAETNSYFSVGLNVERIKYSKTEGYGLIQSPNVTSDGGIMHRDTLGSIKDIVNLDLNSVNLPLFLHFERSCNRFRPFYDVGITFKHFFRNEGSLNRKMYFHTSQYEEKSYKLTLPTNMDGFNLGIGCRYLIDMNTSVSIGYNFGHMINNRELENNLKRYNINRIFLSFNF